MVVAPGILLGGEGCGSQTASPAHVPKATKCSLPLVSFPSAFLLILTNFYGNHNRSIDGKVYPGIIKEKASAQKEYDTAVLRGQSAGLVKYVAILSKAAPMLFLGFWFGWGWVKPWSQPPLSGDKCEKQPWILVGRDGGVCVYIYIHIYKYI